MKTHREQKKKKQQTPKSKSFSFLEECQDHAVLNPNLSKGTKYYLPIGMYHIHHTHTIMKRWQSLLAMNSEVRSHTAGNQTYFRKVMQMKEIEIANLVTAEFGSNTFIKG